HMCMDDAVGPCELEFDCADQLCAACRLEMPDEKRCGECWSAGRVDQAQSGTRRQLEAERRVQVPVGCRRPSPDVVLDQLARWLLVKHSATDVSPRLCIEQPDGGGVGRPRLRSCGLGRLRLEQLWLEHASRYRVGPLEL